MGNCLFSYDNCCNNSSSRDDLSKPLKDTVDEDTNYQEQTELSTAITLIKQQKRDIKALHKRKTELEERLQQLHEFKSSQIPKLAEYRKVLIHQKQVNTDTVMDVYKCLVQTILLTVRGHLIDLLTPPKDIPDHIIQESKDQREQYKVYGLLLSACKIRQTPITSSKLEDVEESYFTGQNKQAVDASIQNALVLTHSMLTLLPPLLLCRPTTYHHELQDTHRVTWDVELDNPLYYYRLVLVYGNQLHVAVKGVVGNKEKEAYYDKR